jgi:hypothetical protein
VTSLPRASSQTGMTPLVVSYKRFRYHKMFAARSERLHPLRQRTMPLAWNEIRHRAIKFSNDWKSAASESAEKQTFWNEFFDVFGIARKTVASFESPVKKVTAPLVAAAKPKRSRRTPARRDTRQPPRFFD